jgi:hypothetical protein
MEEFEEYDLNEAGLDDDDEDRDINSPKRSSNKHFIQKLKKHKELL